MSMQVSSTESDERLERIFKALPYGIDEGVWAKPLGEGQYEVRSIPLLTPNLNFKDVVQIRADYSEGGRHYIGEVVRRSGHKTCGIDFEGLNESQKHEILDKLVSMQLRYENFFEEEMFAVDIAPECDYISICNYLKTLEEQKILRLIGMDS